jgi:hypothetical protein
MAKIGKSCLTALTWLVLGGVLIFSGCVERKLTINTEPQGALIVLNDEEIGVSPVTVGFNWYGDYKVRANKQGYEILNTHRKLEGPLYDKFPFDFFAEILWPGRIVDEYEWTFEMAVYEAPDREQLIEAAQEMKSRAIGQLE